MKLLAKNKKKIENFPQTESTKVNGILENPQENQNSTTTRLDRNIC